MPAPLLPATCVLVTDAVPLRSKSPAKLPVVPLLPIADCPVIVSEGEPLGSRTP